MFKYNDLELALDGLTDIDQKKETLTSGQRVLESSW